MFMLHKAKENKPKKRKRELHSNVCVSAFWKKRKTEKKNDAET